MHIFAEYSKINFSIEKILIKLQNDPIFDLDESELNKILLPIEKLKEIYLHIPEEIWKKNNLKFKSKFILKNKNGSESHQRFKSRLTLLLII